MDRGLYPAVVDGVTVPPAVKKWHEWEQPLEPWVYWLSRLSLPGELIVDPFCGSATVGIACRDLGERQYIGTDISSEHIRTARARLLSF
jgi:site-specific DNA-methyltransferase (adenine-specific)